MRELTRDRYLEDAELAALLRVARERNTRTAPMHYALFCLLANTGLRPSEALAIQLRDLHLTDREPWVRVRRLKTRTEGGRIADVPLSRPLARLLRSYTGLEFFPRKRLDRAGSPERLFPFGLRNAEIMFRRYAARAGLATSFNLYSLRHTALTRALRATGDLRLVQDMAGHASPATTAIYAHVAPAARRELAEKSGGVV